MLLRPLAMTFLAFLACTPSPTRGDAEAYTSQLAPLLDENGLLADHLLKVASRTHHAQLPVTEVTTVWTQDLAPLAQHLHIQATLIQPPAEWVVEHARLIQIWGHRAQGYELIAQGLHHADASRVKRGRALSDQAKLEEESWFQDINTRLAPDGLALDQLP
jgi:hypothetical protein